MRISAVIAPHHAASRARRQIVRRHIVGQHIVGQLADDQSLIRRPDPDHVARRTIAG
jgi:hypothetical protein